MQELMMLTRCFSFSDSSCPLLLWQWVVKVTALAPLLKGMKDVVGLAVECLLRV